MLIYFILKDKGQLEGLKKLQKKLYRIPLKIPEKKPVEDNGN